MASRSTIESAFSDALMKDKGHFVRKIVTRYAFTDDELGGWLSLATCEGKIKVMQELLLKGANVNYQNAEGESPLSYACSRNQLEAAKLLFDFGADVNVQLRNGSTPLDWAVCHSSDEFIIWLESVGGTRHQSFD